MVYSISEIAIKIIFYFKCLLYSRIIKIILNTKWLVYLLYISCLYIGSCLSLENKSYNSYC